MDRLYQAFITGQNEKNGSILFFNRIWDAREVFRTGLFVMQVVTFDVVLVREPLFCWVTIRLLTQVALSFFVRTSFGEGTCG